MMLAVVDEVIVVVSETFQLQPATDIGDLILTLVFVIAVPNDIQMVMIRPEIRPIHPP